MGKLVVLLVVGACYSPQPTPGSPCGNGAPCPGGLECSAITSTCEVPGTTPDARPSSLRCLGTGIVQICLDEAPTDPLDLAGLVNTDSSSLCVRSDLPVCAIAGTTVTVDAVTVTGSRPLVIFSNGMLVVEGVLDASSVPNRLGPASTSAACVSPAASDDAGGPGGSFGGRGGSGVGNVTTASAPPVVPTALRAGCPGSVGSSPTIGAGGIGGDGGGAVALLAGEQIRVTGDINASGAGGGGGKIAAQGSGGGGGGSGGMIVLDAPSIQIALGARVFANGGGGGEGGSTANGNPGASPSGPILRAAGGSGTNGGDGGAGSAGILLDGVNGMQNNEAGGAGGGGAGVVKAFGAFTGPTSPPRS